jgi:para-nitrobenzyl esterase
MSVVATTGGVVRGVIEDGVHRFLGVPYGSAERFRLAEPARWDGTFDAARFGSACPPTLTANDRAFFPRSPLWQAYAGIDDRTVFDEDCLRLNVWTPGLDHRARPVLVWLHGGGFSWGSGSSSWTLGDRLASRNNVVVVTLNHRLGILGYLDLEDAVGEEWTGSGVAGLVDLRLALEWVRDNISSFGGDPGSVTIVGHSGGGAKVAALLALPSAEGLFHRAVIQSGVVSLRSVDRDEAAAHASAVLERAGGVDALRAMPVAQLTELGAPYRFRPAARTRLLPAHPFDPVAAPSAAHVPLLIGTTLDDAATFKFDSDPAFPSLDDEALRAWVAEHQANEFGDLADDAIAFHRQRLPGASASRLVTAVATQRLRERTETLVERKLAGGDAPVYVYAFVYRAPMPDDTIFAGEELSSHGIEIPFVFDRAELEPIAGDAPWRTELARQMSSCWAAFARTGDPGWPPWNADDRLMMVFDEMSAVRRDPFEEEQPLFERLRRSTWTTSASR